MNASMACRNSTRLLVLSPRRALRDKMPNQISTWAGLPRRRRRLQQSQHSVAKVRAINRLGAGSWRIVQPGQPALHKALPPLNDGVGTGVTSSGNFPNSLASQTTQDHLRSLGHLFRFGPTSGQALQRLPVCRTTSNGRCISCHGCHYTTYRVSLQVSTRWLRQCESGQYSQWKRNLCPMRIQPGGQFMWRPPRI